jgi:poly(hydroxyalkanoate) depolymerase family esterase
MRVRRSAHWAIACAISIAACDPPRVAVAPAPSTFLSDSLTTAAGTRRYKLFVPAGMDRKAPVMLVVMLHGCTQTADDFARGTRMNLLAARERFLVLYPEQDRAANPQTCWNWFDPRHQTRDSGEPSLIADMTRRVINQYPVDPRRVFVAGISAGGIMASTVAFAYPDLYAAVGMHSAVPYGVASDVPTALSAMRGTRPTGSDWKHAGYRAMGSRARVIPAIVIHGDKDAVALPVNAASILAQWIATNDLADDGQANETVIGTRADSGVTSGGHHWTRATFSTSTGQPVIELLTIDELGHAWAGGAAEGTYTDPKSIDATGELIRFFMAHPRPAR